MSTIAKFNRGGSINPDDQRDIHAGLAPAHKRAQVASPVRTTAASGTTYEGGQGYERDTKSELFMLAVTNFVGEETFYESANERDVRYAQKVREMAIQDPIWLFDLLKWLRVEGNMRSAPLVGACEAVSEILRNGSRWSPETVTAVQNWGDGSERGLLRSLIGVVCQRADEPGELLAYWTSHYGKAIPQPVKRGLADATRRLYSEYALLRYDTATRGGGGGYRFGDVLELTHPTPTAPWQSALFQHAIDRRHNREIEWGALADPLPMVFANMALREEAADGTLDGLTNADQLKAAGMTWEDTLSLAGSKVDKAKLWEALIPTMGYMALLRNLRNFDEAGVGDSVAEAVSRRLSDPAQVARSRQFPFRFYSAHNAVASLRWGHALEQALSHATGNIPALRGGSLVLFDTSGSMQATATGKSQMTHVTMAALFGGAVALRAQRAGGTVDLVGFADGVFSLPVPKGGSLLKLVDEASRRIGSVGHGTNIHGAIRASFDPRKHSRVILISDMQTIADGQVASYSGWGRLNTDPISSHVPPSTPIYGFNTTGYRRGAMPTGASNRHELGGITDATFRQIPYLEAGRDGRWPWQDHTEG